MTYEQLEAALQAFFGNTKVRPEETLNGLRNIIDSAQTMVEALESEQEKG
jgi:hypothetical protein